MNIFEDFGVENEYIFRFRFRKIKYIQVMFRKLIYFKIQVQAQKINIFLGQVQKMIILYLKIKVQKMSIFLGLGLKN